MDLNGWRPCDLSDDGQRVLWLHPNGGISSSAGFSDDFLCHSHQPRDFSLQAKGLVSNDTTPSHTVVPSVTEPGGSKANTIVRANYKPPPSSDPKHPRPMRLGRRGRRHGARQTLSTRSSTRDATSMSLMQLGRGCWFGTGHQIDLFGGCVGF